MKSLVVVTLAIVVLFGIPASAGANERIQWKPLSSELAKASKQKRMPLLLLKCNWWRPQRGCRKPVLKGIVLSLNFGKQIANTTENLHEIWFESFELGGSIALMFLKTKGFEIGMGVGVNSLRTFYTDYEGNWVVWFTDFTLSGVASWAPPIWKRILDVKLELGGGVRHFWSPFVKEAVGMIAGTVSLGVNITTWFRLAVYYRFSVGFNQPDQVGNWWGDWLSHTAAYPSNTVGLALEIQLWRVP